VSVAASLRRRGSFDRIESTRYLAPQLTPTTLRYKAQLAMRPTLRTESIDRARRLLNIAVASVGIVLTAPIMLLVAVLVKATSPGPVIFYQDRIGVDRRRGRANGAPNHRRALDRGGRIFRIYKFRTMSQDSASALQVWASKDDPRITSVGRVLRAFRLDELPQLFNVLKGDMNIVGPRPEQPDIFTDLCDEVQRYRDRQRVLPGITGLAQISLPYDASVEDVEKKVKFDLEYIRHRSVGQDLVIMAKTMPVMVFRKGSV